MVGGKREGRNPSRGERGKFGMEDKRRKYKLLRVLTQACTIQPLRMGRMHTA